MQVNGPEGYETSLCKGPVGPEKKLLPPWHGSFLTEPFTRHGTDLHCLSPGHATDRASSLTFPPCYRTYSVRRLLSATESRFWEALCRSLSRSWKAHPFRDIDTERIIIVHRLVSVTRCIASKCFSLRLNCYDWVFGRRIQQLDVTTLIQFGRYACLYATLI